MSAVQFSPAPKVVARCNRCGDLCDGELGDFRMWDLPWTEPAEHRLLCADCQQATAGELR